MRVRVFVAAGALAICVPVALAATNRPSGDLDPTFGTAGRVIVKPSLASRAEAAFVQPDGKVVLGGFVTDPAPPGHWENRDFLAIRLDRNGRLDGTFGAGGIVRTAIDLGDVNWDLAAAVALGPEGNIVLAGKAWKNLGEGDVAVVRYTPSGALDPSFSGDGIVTLDMGRSESVTGVAAQADGKIIVVGHAGAGFMVMRLLSNGALDESFGSGGIVDTNVGDPRNRDGAAAVVVLGDGKIVVAGESDFDSHDAVSINFAVVRYLPSGQRDPTFGSDGIVVTAGPNVELAFGVAAAPGGKIVVAGSDRTYGQSGFHVARYLTSGGLDATFGSGGTVTTSFAGMLADASSVVVEPDGRILAGGIARPAPGAVDFAVARYRDDGTLDDTFGVDGKRTYGLSGNAFGSALAIQPAAARSGADRLVLAGDEELSGGDDHVAAIGIDLGPPPPPPVRCRVPRVVGLTLNRARARIRSAHCRVGRVRRAHSARRRGHVISQRPRAGRRLPRGSRVNLVISLGR